MSITYIPISSGFGLFAKQITDSVRRKQSKVEWDWKGKCGFFWGGTAFLVFLWSYFRLPEIKGRTYEELDILFTNKVPARKFAGTHVDAYAQAHHADEVHYDEPKA